MSEITTFLEYNLCKNVSNRLAFLWQTHIQTIEYGLNDTIWYDTKEIVW